MTEKMPRTLQQRPLADKKKAKFNEKLLIFFLSSKGVSFVQILYTLGEFYTLKITLIHILILISLAYMQWTGQIKPN